MVPTVCDEMLIKGNARILRTYRGTDVFAVRKGPPFETTRETSISSSGPFPALGLVLLGLVAAGIIGTILWWWFQWNVNQR